jgi:hypothetical protein
LHFSITHPVTILQDKLKRHFSDTIAIQAQRGQGKSNFVFTSEISMGSVMAEADNLKKKLKTSEMVDPKS